MNEIMEIQSQISFDLNQNKINKVFNCVIDRKEGVKYVGRTEFDSPDVDNGVSRCNKILLKIGEFVKLKIFSATEFSCMRSQLKIK